ncbi:hypothetical protein [Afipia sp. GAS231]|uniref:COG3904 family protein n=1 Tax=Afipia sp. GAS231 TaxID=1882747 RepID=UPI00087BE35C|nr:hypothetical protein [Afipia sp. GAS231]SDN17706.1 hypothetical protein SAMN05444050_0899 [Afipia sp. GAS231]
MISRLLLVVALLLIHGELRAEPSEAEKHGFAPKFIIYNAKGPADSCGPGCDRWIAAEGEVDTEAAARVRRFLSAVKDTKRPIYFHSPGGVVEQSYVIGRLLRSRKAIARIGRTVAAACAGGTQVDAACLKIKTGGGEVEAQLETRNAMCNSACSYLFLGATTREVATDAVVGVHNSRLTLVVHGHPPPRLEEQFRERGMEKANRERAAFVASMGISRELDDLIKTVKFESIHALTRAELYRFGIDTRSTIEGPWTLESLPRGSIFKTALVKKPDSSDFRRVGWRLACRNGDGARLTFLHEISKDVKPANSVELLLGPEKRFSFLRAGGTAGNYAFWNLIMESDTLITLLSTPRVQIEENIQLANGNPTQSKLEFDAAGLEDTWKKVAASCRAGEPTIVPRSSGPPAFIASPAARVTATRPEPGSMWPGVKPVSPAVATPAAH